ncbi:MAG: hypothetical protein ACYDB9_03580 [Gammaproteobacteria bacterium]
MVKILLHDGRPERIAFELEADKDPSGFPLASLSTASTGEGQNNKMRLRSV